MRVSCPNVVLFAAAFTLACGESTAPSALAGVYQLERIDGRILPANIVAQQGDTITVLWGALSLDGSGNAELVEHVRIVHPNTPAVRLTQTTGYVYHITGHSYLGDQLSFDYSPPCPPNALCVEPPTATTLGEALILSYGDFSYSRPPSFYRRHENMAVPN